VGNKPCWPSVVDKTLSSHSHVSNEFSKGILPIRLSGSCPSLILVADGLANFGGSEWTPAGYREPLWSCHSGNPCAYSMKSQRILKKSFLSLPRYEPITKYFSSVEYSKRQVKVIYFLFLLKKIIKESVVKNQQQQFQRSWKFFEKKTLILFMKVILFRKWPLRGIDDCICLSWRRDRARIHRVDTTPSNPHTVHNKWEQDKHFTLECFRRSKGLVAPAPALLNSYFVVVIHSVIHSAVLSSRSTAVLYS
jgi:hypothetical protein